MDRNPVKRGLVASPELWRWSSFRYYAYGEPGPVAVNAMLPLHWTAKKRTAAQNHKVESVARGRDLSQSSRGRLTWATRQASYHLSVALPGFGSRSRLLLLALRREFC